MSTFGIENHAPERDDVSLVDMFVLASHFPVLFLKPTLLEVKVRNLKHPGRGAVCTQTKENYTRCGLFGQTYFSAVFHKLSPAGISTAGISMPSRWLNLFTRFSDSHRVQG